MAAEGGTASASAGRRRGMAAWRRRAGSRRSRRRCLRRSSRRWRRSRRSGAACPQDLAKRTSSLAAARQRLMGTSAGHRQRRLGAWQRGSSRRISKMTSPLRWRVRLSSGRCLTDPFQAGSVRQGHVARWAAPRGCRRAVRLLCAGWPPYDRVCVESVPLVWCRVLAFSRYVRVARYHLNPTSRQNTGALATGLRCAKGLRELQRRSALCRLA
jgi:hypothetical protein